MRNSVSDVTDAEILDETREAMTQAAFDAADEASAAETVESATENLPAFDELGLSDEMLRAIENLGYTAPTPVQAGSIPVVLEGRDLLAAAQTGTGKTAAFLLPTMNNLEHIAPPKPVRERGSRNRRRGAKKPEGNGRGPVMLVITPTRELAQQIDEVASKIADVTGHVAVTVVGGVSYKPQTAALKYGCDILVATPGRLVDLIEQGACHLNEVKVLVLDEADRMLDMGFLPAVRRIVRETPAERQTLLFSATIDSSIQKNLGNLLKDPAIVEIARNGDDYGDVAGRSNRGRDERRGDGERPSRPKRGGKTRVREGVQARVDEAVESVAREVAAEERDGAVEQGPRGNRAERRAKQFQGEAHRRRREDEDRGGRRRVEREDEGRGSRGGKRSSGDRRRSGRDDERGGRDERRGGEGRGERSTRGGESRGGKRFEERGSRGGERREGARGNGGRGGAGRSNESRDRRDPRASRDRRDDWRNYDDTREERRGGYRGGRGGNQTGSRGGRAGGRDNRGSYGNSRGGKRGGSSRRPGDGGGKRK